MGGFFGTIANNDCTMDLYYGTDYNSHLGTRRGGMAMLSENGFVRSIHNLENSYFRTKFEGELKNFSGNSGIGVISDTDSQPIIVNSHLGKFAIVTIAKVNNLDELEKELLEEGHHFAEFSSGITNQTELLAMLIAQGRTFVEGIENVYRKVKGSCTLMLLTKEGIVVARDRFGRLPVVIGKKEGAFAISGETSSFPNLDFEPDYFLGPGEIMMVRADGYTQLRRPEKRLQICSFMWVYYGYPPSEYEHVNVDTFRYRSGLLMSSSDDVKADFVSGIPDSGIGHALGYAEGLHVPYKRAIVKYTPTWPRSFTPSNQKMRQLVAKMKLIPNRALLEGKKVVFCDDSIVRGTQLRDNVNILYGYGAKEVHMRISCPPLLYSCPFINFSASKSEMELITRRVIEELEGANDKNLEEYTKSGSPCHCKMVETICKKFGMTSLKFNTLENLVKAIGLPKESICTHCFDGSSYME